MDSIEPQQHRASRPIAHFLGTLVLLLVCTPIFQSVPWGRFADATLLTLVYLTGLRAVGGRRKVFGVAVGMLIPALVGAWIRGMQHALLARVFAVVSGVLFVGFVVERLLRYVLRARRVDGEVLAASVAGYISMGICYAFAYSLISDLLPTAFLTGRNGVPVPLNSYDAIYFSFATLATLGLNDVVPSTGATRMLMITEALAGTFYMTLLIARLVSIHSSAWGRDEQLPLQ